MHPSHPSETRAPGAVFQRAQRFAPTFSIRHTDCGRPTIALIIGSPSIVGQVALGYPVIGQMRDLAGSQLTHVTWSAFIIEQVLMIGPVAFAVALAGEMALLAWRPLRPFRMLAVACLVPFVILLLLHGKGYYAGPIYPTLLAVGGVLIERAPFALASWPDSA